MHSQINIIAHLLAFDPLEDKPQRERNLKFDYNGRRTVFAGDNVTVRDFGFDLVPVAFKESLHGRVKVGFSDHGRTVCGKMRTKFDDDGIVHSWLFATVNNHSDSGPLYPHQQIFSFLISTRSRCLDEVFRLRLNAALH